MCCFFKAPLKIPTLEYAQKQHLHFKSAQPSHLVCLCERECRLFLSRLATLHSLSQNLYLHKNVLHTHKEITLFVSKFCEQTFRYANAGATDVKNTNQLCQYLSSYLLVTTFTSSKELFSLNAVCLCWCVRSGDVLV